VIPLGVMSGLESEDGQRHTRIEVRVLRSL